MASVLAGRRVVVTRAAEQADELAGLLQQVGAIPVVIPLIAIVADASGVQQLAGLAGHGLAGFEWVVVTSPNGASALVDAAPSQISGRVAAIGAATADALRAGGVAVALVPQVQSAVGLLADFPVAPSTVLVVQAANADLALADGLRERGADVTVVAPYRTVAARVNAAQQLAALAADAVLFASGSAARAWADVFGDSTPPIVVAIGPLTAAAATNAGLKVAVIAADHSLSGMVQALETHLFSQS